MYAILSSLITAGDLSLILWEYFFVELIIVILHLMFCLKCRSRIVRLLPTLVIGVILIIGIVSMTLKMPIIGLLALLVCAGAGFDIVLAWIIYGIIIAVSPKSKTHSQKRRRR